MSSSDPHIPSHDQQSTTVDLTTPSHQNLNAQQHGTDSTPWHTSHVNGATAMSTPVEPATGSPSWKAQISSAFSKKALCGDYDWSFLCMPRLCVPRRSRSSGEGDEEKWKAHRMPPFFSKDEKIPFLLALVMGLQHALAMVGGIITAPVIISASANFSSPEIKAYLVSAALIVTAVASFIQVHQIKIPFTKYVLGSGLLSVMGVSFAYVPVAQNVIHSLQTCSCNGTPCQVNGSCQGCPQELQGHCYTGEEAYGAILGTILVVCWFQTALSFLSPRIIRRIFPPIVTGTCLILIGVSLVSTGFELWGGGQYCASQVLTTKAPCSGNGEVELPFAHRYYLGLGLVVFLSFIGVELFGSPFMRNIQVIIALVISMIVAAAARVNTCTENCAPPVCPAQICYNVLPQGVNYNNVTNTVTGTPLSSYPNSTVCIQPECAAAVCSGLVCNSLRYITADQIVSARWVTFLWTHKFPLKFYAPAVLPLLFASIVAATECIGDITATTEASGLIPYGPDYERSVQGALLADGVNAFWAALGTSIPLTTYAQNNGIITLSRCASRRAGYACCFWLFLLGVVAKFAAVFISIPNCILGALTACLVASVVVSGIHVINSREGLTRRNRFIATLALGVGLGVSLVPDWVNITGQPTVYPNEGNFWPVNPKWSDQYRGFRDAVILFVSNGFSIGGFTAFFLNLILPFEKDSEDNKHTEN